MGILNTAIAYDGVYSAVQLLLDSGKTLDDISLRDIRSALGNRGSLSTIAKHFAPIKLRLARGEALDSIELSETDMEALRSIVRDIIDRRTVLTRKEKEDSAQATADVIRELEANLAMKDEVIVDLEHQAFALEGECEAQTLVSKDLNEKVARLEGMVEALNATIAMLAPLGDAVASNGTGSVTERPLANATNPRDDGQVEMPLGTAEAEDTSAKAGGDQD